MRINDMPGGHLCPRGILPDFATNFIPIEPRADGISRPGVISYGTTSYGYDVRVGYKFKIFTAALCAVVDPKNFDQRTFVDVDLDEKGRHCIDDDYRCTVCNHQYADVVDAVRHIEEGGCHNYILVPPNSFALAETVETFEIPRDVLAICLGKSTYARCGIIVNVTPLEPEWRGKITIEISNTTPLPAKIYAGEGIAQIIFLRAQECCKVSYADKKGRYQDQAGLTLPFVPSTLPFPGG